MTPPLYSKLVDIAHKAEAEYQKLEGLDHVPEAVKRSSYW